MIKVWTDAAEAGLLDRQRDRGSAFAYLPETLLGRALWPPPNLRDEPPGRRVAGTAATRLREGDWNLR